MKCSQFQLKTKYMKKSKPVSLKQLKATEAVIKLREKATNDQELMSELGISKGTFYTRLKESNWKKSEIVLINFLSK